MNRTVRTIAPLIATFALAAAGLPLARADVAPPVEIKLDVEASAAAGAEFAGTFRVNVFRPGLLTDFRIEGVGWTLRTAEFPAANVGAVNGVFTIPFRALPADADKPITLSLRYNGRLVRHSFEVGPAYFARRGQAHALMGLPQTSGLPDGASPGFGPRGGSIRVVGRIVYTRPDSRVVGADRIDVRVEDVDPTGSEEMWAGHTDENGYFDTGDISADVDGDGSGPDLRIYVETETTDWVDVTDASVTEDTYEFESGEVEDFEGGFYDFGWLAPLDGNLHTAFHIFNAVTRVRRFSLEHAGQTVDQVQVEWPSDDTHYEEGPEEIHLAPGEQWEEDTIIHEYGHHYVHQFSSPHDPDYCNGFCDGSNPPESCTHCVWCPENQFDAFNEGWPDWLADAVCRGMRTRYHFDDSTGYEAVRDPGGLFEIETPQMCQGSFRDPLTTEGFIAALLRDIEDMEQDDHDQDQLLDQLCVGPGPMLSILIGHQPLTIVDFLNAFQATFPQHRARLWPTAYNAGGPAYLIGFPADTQAPGIVPAADSPSHPIGVGGSLSCITLDFEPAPDDVTGSSVYSVIATTNPAGQNPGTELWPVLLGTENCRLRTLVPVLDLGTYYISIRARDSNNVWSPSWATFGPFVVLDCNGSGLLDVCDISCSSQGIPNCMVNELCSGRDGCGLSSDCNQNFQPDECDIAQGASEDCNQNGVPDECETSTLKHWVGDDAMHPTYFELGSNWAEGEAPGNGDSVCIAAGEPTPWVRRDSFTLSTLACYQDLEVATAAGNPGAVLRLLDPSFVAGDLSQASGIIQVDDALAIEGIFTHSNGTLRGLGQTNVLGAFMITGSPDIVDHTLNLHCNTTATGGYQGNNFTIRNFAGQTYDHDGGNVTVADGNAASRFINEGTFVKSGGAGSLRFGLRVINPGLMRAEAGTLSIRNLTCTGDVLGLAGTTIEFGSGIADFEPGSSLIGDLINPRTSATTVNIRGTYQANNTTLGASGEAPILNFLPGANILDYGDNFIITGGAAHFETVHGGPLQLQNLEVRGSAYFDSGDPIEIQTLTLGPGGGTVRGASQQITIHGLFTWNNVGNILDPGIVDAIGGILVQPSSSNRQLARDLRNHATATFLGQLGPSSTGRFTNLATGLALLQGDSTGVVSGTVLNAGTIRKNAGTGRSTLAALENSGLVHVQTGELYFYVGGTNTGEIRGEPGTLLTFNGSIPNPHEMSPASILTADDITFTGQGTNNIRGAVNIVDTLTEDGPSTVFTSEASVTSYGQHLDLQAGTVQFQAPTPAPTLTFDTAFISGNVHFTTGQPVRVNTLTLTTGAIQGPSPITVNNSFTFRSGTIQPGGLMTAIGPVSIDSNGNTRNLQRDFDNAGVMTFVNGGLQLANATLHNLPTGTIDIPTIGTAFGLTTTATLQNDGLLVKSAGAGVSTIANHTRNAGTVEVRAGTLQLTGTNGITHIQTAGQTILNGGNLTVTAPGSYQLQGGDFLGNGTVTGALVNSGGVVKPGLSAGTLAVVGTYSQQAAGGLEIEIGGTAPGQFDVLTVSGSATIAGGLSVQAIDGFTPSPGDSFVILTAASINGTFATVTGAPGFAVSYTPTQVILTADGQQLPGDVDGDCDVDLTDLATVLTHFGSTGATREMGDLDGDGDVDLSDLAALLANFGAACP